MIESCKYEVKPLPYEFCGGCMLNGCYPWNRVPFFLCSKMGGVHPIILATEENLPRQCLSFKPVTDRVWDAHLEDLKREALWNEETRLKAMKGKVFSSELLPAESIGEKGKEVV